MGSWLPPLRAAEISDVCDQGNGSNQSHRTIQVGFEKELDDIGDQTPTSQSLKPMERFEAEGVSEQPFSSAMVDPHNNKDAGERRMGKVDRLLVNMAEIFESKQDRAGCLEHRDK